MKKPHLRLNALALLPWLAYLPAAQAATATTDFNITAHVPTSCSISTAPAEYDIALNKGLYSASFDPRQMGNGTYRLNYNLYRESTRNQIWGDGTGGTWVVSGTIPLTILLPNGSAEHVIYGRIPGPQATAHEGNYSDTITVTVDYDIGIL